MIESFKCEHTKAFFQGRHIAKFVNIERVAMRKLQMIHAAANINFLRIPPQNRLEALKGDRQGQHSIRINDQWRICFKFTDGNAHDVEIVDYH